MTTLEGEEFGHCTRVLRHIEGDQINITDGKGLKVLVTITQINKNELFFAINQQTVQERPARPIQLFLAPTKQQERMEWMTEKLAELGVASINFIQCNNSERAKLRLDRLRKKTLSALKQSKGAWLTEVNEMISFSDALQKSTADLRLLAALHTTTIPFKSVLTAEPSIDLFIGPEGDFSPRELDQALAKGMTIVSLGDQVLRTETAGLYVCAAAHFAHQTN